MSDLVPLEHRDQSAWLRMAVDTLQKAIQDVIYKPAGSVQIQGRTLHFITEEQRAVLIARHRTAMRLVSGGYGQPAVMGQPAPRTTPLPRGEQTA